MNVRVLWLKTRVGRIVRRLIGCQGLLRRTVPHFVRGGSTERDQTHCFRGQMHAVCYQSNSNPRLFPPRCEMHM